MLPDYPRAESLLLAQIRAVDGYNQENTFVGKWGILNNGKSAKYAIIRPGANTISYGSARVDVNWTSIVEIYQKYLDDGPSLTSLEGDVRAVMNRLILYPHMGDTTGAITQAAITSMAEPVRVDSSPNGPYWLMQALTITWLEQIVVEYLE